MAKETYIGGTTNKSKHIPDLGYLGIPVSGVGKSKRILKGYIGNAQNKSKLFWEYGGGIVPRYVARWTQKYVSNVGYNINLEDVGKTIKYPFIRALWLSEGVDDAIHEYFKKRYKHLNTIITRVLATMSANNLNVVRVVLTIRGDNVVDDSVVFTIQMGVRDLQNKYLDYGHYAQGGRFAYEFVNQSETNGVAFKKLMYAEVYENTVTINEQDYTSNSRLEATFSTGSENPFYCYGTNAGIVFQEEEGTDLVDIIDFQGKTKEFEKYIVSDYSLNAAITPSESVAYNNVQIDANGATMTNDVCCITIPEWWVWGGLFYIELDLGYMPSSVTTQSDYIYLLSFNAMVGIAYNKTQGVWGVWDRENNNSNTMIFRPSNISSIGYFANSKVKICFDELSGTIGVFKGDTLAFTTQFTFRGTFSDKIEAADLYIGGYRTVSARDANCVSGMVTKAVRVYKNKFFNKIIKKAYHEKDQYITEGLFDIPVTISESTSFSYVMRIVQDATLTNYYTTVDRKIVSNTSKVYLALCKNRDTQTPDPQYWVAYISENPFTYQVHSINGMTGREETNNFSSVETTRYGRTYYFGSTYIGWKIGGSYYRHRYYSSSFDIAVMSGSSASSTNYYNMWELAYIVFTGNVQNY